MRSSLLLCVISHVNPHGLVHRARHKRKLLFQCGAIYSTSALRAAGWKSPLLLQNTGDASTFVMLSWDFEAPINQQVAGYLVWDQG